MRRKKNSRIQNFSLLQRHYDGALRILCQIAQRARRAKVSVYVKPVSSRVSRVKSKTPTRAPNDSCAGQFLHFCQRLRQESFHLIISNGVISGDFSSTAHFRLLSKFFSHDIIPEKGLSKMNLENLFPCIAIWQRYIQTCLLYTSPSPRDAQ